MDEAVLARFSASGVRTYLHAHQDKLAKFLATAGQGEEKELLKLLDQFGAALELVDRIEIVSRGSDHGIRVAARVKLAKPLKK